MTNPRDPQTVTSTVIPSQWGQDVNDRVVQVFQNVAALRAPHADYTPQIGSLAYTTDERGLWRYVGPGFTSAPGGWESAVARGLLRPVLEPGTQVDLPNGPTWATILGLVIGNIRQGCTYLVMYSGNPYTKSNNISLFGSQVYLCPEGFPNSPIGPEGAGSVYPAAAGWPASIFSSVNQAGTRPIGPMPAHVSSAAVVWRGQTYPGQPVVTLTDIRIGVVEVGGPS